MTPDQLPYAPDLIVVDVSFISLTKVLPAVLACVADEFDCLAMVKPQFEVGKDRVGKGGVVRDLELRREAVRSVAAAVRRRGDGQRAVRARRARPATARRSCGSPSAAAPEP